jgi:hypothetical protein
MKYSEQRLIHHAKDSAQIYLDSFDFESSFFFSIKSEMNLIGTATIYLEIHENITFGNIGILIGKRYSQNGFGLEAWQGIKSAFGDLKKPIILLAGTRKDNLAMNLIAIRSGMVPITPSSNPLENVKVNFEFDLMNYYYEKY